MPLVHMKDMLQHAWENHYAVGGFDLVSLDFLEGIMEAAERESSPVILSLAESHFEYYDFQLAMAASVAAAERASVPVAIHLDHGASMETAVEAIRLGCNGIMVDASHHPFEQNVALTRELVTMAHGCGVPVEGELGYVAGVEGEDAERHPGEVIYTQPEEAARYIEETGVDFLAVSIGTVHGRMRGQPRLDLERLRAINEKVQQPLVIHGGTGLSDAQFCQLIDNGVAKINYYTALSDAAAHTIRANMNDQAGYTRLLDGVRSAISKETARCMQVFRSSGQAESVLACAQPWRPVEHVILYNVEGIDSGQVDALMAEGRRVLGQIPGVQRVITGRAIQKQARYAFAWLVEFVHPAVIDSYRDHPAHVAFADQHFRPVAGDRVSIDFQT